MGPNARVAAAAAINALFIFYFQILMLAKTAALG